ncbi:MULTISPECIES: beta-glucosidase family protein [unclassified Sphingobium]|uniref:beta-glucosidase family protein n=1 Tax=unclassified Sphingobium TaxID=2611147 RepID=UPI00119ADD50|nr:MULTISPECIES: beta-glucosidase [unclassified Sphingobium]MBG6120217.1 beta-glucosidase [Sphingobium sp. JAI105]TWD00127.1 beta-glucosidase [Sphingobium sp. AEW010]TWD19238.1 beta-glucosidase [Sphingobium sp. AEW013]TWD22097.1 beta-glucosidase [Sphingobium sp. AEW001]
MFGSKERLLANRKLRVLTFALMIGCAEPSLGQNAVFPWSDPALSPDKRAELVLSQMTPDEKIALVHGHSPSKVDKVPTGVISSAGYVAGIPRLGILMLKETDASLGVSNARRTGDDAIALPSGMALAATWNPDTAFAGGAMIAKEARHKGFNVLLAGGVNLARDPFNGRNFEYLGEDPLLTGAMGGSSIRGVQSQHIVSTVKHLVLNAQETGRKILDARISNTALHESDLLAFELAIEKGDPGALMCAYNKLNGSYACENQHLLTDVLKKDWGFKGWVMSDWGAVHSVDTATAGLDQQSGAEHDTEIFFDRPLRQALADGRVSESRVDDMVRRILRSMFANGLMDPQHAPGPWDPQAEAAVAQQVAESGIVLLKNEGNVLPLAATAKRIAVIGGHADIGVLSGGGSSQVVPKGSLVLPSPAGVPSWIEGVVYHPSPPLQAIRVRAPKADVTFDKGDDIAAAVARAKAADVAILFVEQWTTEAVDASLRLSEHQENLIRAVGAANPQTIVVLETGGPVLMPWIDSVKGVVEAWYAGSRGGVAIARILFGEVNPSGRLPVTFARSADQLVRSSPACLITPGQEELKAGSEKVCTVDYIEGSSIGYRWFAAKRTKPLFPFGYGLSYARFRYGTMKLTGEAGLTATITITNTGSRAGLETAQLYLRKGPTRNEQRLLGWVQVALQPGESKTVAISAEPRLLANWDENGRVWRIDAGTYEVVVGSDASTVAAQGHTMIQAAEFKPTTSPVN